MLLEIQQFGKVIERATPYGKGPVCCSAGEGKQGFCQFLLCTNKRNLSFMRARKVFSDRTFSSLVSWDLSWYWLGQKGFWGSIKGTAFLLENSQHSATQLSVQIEGQELRENFLISNVIQVRDYCRFLCIVLARLLSPSSNWILLFDLFSLDWSGFRLSARKFV